MPYATQHFYFLLKLLAPLSCIWLQDLDGNLGAIEFTPVDRTITSFADLKRVRKHICCLFNFLNGVPSVHGRAVSKAFTRSPSLYFGHSLLCFQFGDFFKGFCSDSILLHLHELYGRRINRLRIFRSLLFFRFPTLKLHCPLLCSHSFFAGRAVHIHRLLQFLLQPPHLEFNII
ncbi:hypothetical protein V8G54_011454, partial [Vigna mungo]